MPPHEVRGLDAGDGGVRQAQDPAIARRSGRALDIGVRGGSRDAAVARALARRSEAGRRYRSAKFEMPTAFVRTGLKKDHGYWYPPRTSTPPGRRSDSYRS